MEFPRYERHVGVRSFRNVDERQPRPIMGRLHYLRLQNSIRFCGGNPWVFTFNSPGIFRGVASCEHTLTHLACTARKRRRFPEFSTI